MGKRIITEENAQIGYPLKTAREACGVLQSEMCAATGLSKNHISALERGVSKVSVQVLLAYCRKLDMTPNDVLGYDEKPIDPELKDMIGAMDKEKQKKVKEMIRLMENW